MPPNTPDDKKDLSSPSKREQERIKEDSVYHSVVIKRFDNWMHHPSDTLSDIIKESVEEFKKPNLSLFLSAFAGGLIVSFSVLCVGVSEASLLSEQVHSIVPAFLYPLGFIICILSRTQLFTEQTATAIYSFRSKKISLIELLKFWALIIFGNLTGTMIMGLILFVSEPVINAEAGYLAMARKFTTPEPGIVFFSALLAGMLMAQGSWLIHSLRDGMSQIFAIYGVVLIIGLGKLHHSIVGSTEIVLATCFDLQNFPLQKSIAVLSVVLLGNCIGGVVFVALINFARLRTFSD